MIDVIVVGKINHSSMGYGQNRRIFSAEGIAPCIDTAGGGNREPKVLIPPGKKMTYTVSTISESSEEVKP